MSINHATSQEWATAAAEPPHRHRRRLSNDNNLPLSTRNFDFLTQLFSPKLSSSSQLFTLEHFCLLWNFFIFSSLHCFFSSFFLFIPMLLLSRCENLMTCPMKEIGSGDWHCPYDWLAIHDGRDENAPLIGKFCGMGKFPFSIVGELLIFNIMESVDLNFIEFIRQAQLSTCLSNSSHRLPVHCSITAFTSTLELGQVMLSRLAKRWECATGCWARLH